jgi:threonine dehydratase/cystathionine beta-lyase/cystathionine gamma-synthase
MVSSGHGFDQGPRQNQVAVSELVDAIQQAHERINPHTVRTPTVRLPWLDAPGREVWAKLDCQQHSGSFSFRGALNALIQTTRKRAVTVSNGNFALAAAAAGKRLGKDIHVIATTTAASSTIQRLSYDANLTLTLHGENILEADKEAQRMCKASSSDADGGHHYLSPYADLNVAAGAGTLLIEAIEDAGSFDHVISPLGSGCLAAAIGAWCSQQLPSTEVHCAHPKVFGRQFASRNGRALISKQLRQPTCSSYSAGLSFHHIEETPFANILDSTIHSVIQVSETDTAAAIARTLWLQSLLVEASAATAIASLIQSTPNNGLQGRVLLLLTGGNADSDVVTQALVTTAADRKSRGHLSLQQVSTSEPYDESICKQTNDRDDVSGKVPSTIDVWPVLASRLQDESNRLSRKFHEKQRLSRRLGLQTDDWCASHVSKLHSQFGEFAAGFAQHVQASEQRVVDLWRTEERFRLLIQFRAMLGSLLHRASASNDQSQRDWFFEPEAQDAAMCNYARYGSNDLKGIEKTLMQVLRPGDPKDIRLMLTSSGMASYVVIQNYLLQRLGSNGVVVVPPYIYFETLEQFEALEHVTVVAAPSFSADDIIATAEEHNALVVFLDPVANNTDLNPTDVRYFAQTVSTRPGWKDRFIVLDGTMIAGGLSFHDWFDGPHAPTVLYYESGTKYLQLGLDLQMIGILIYPSRLHDTLSIIRSNTGTVMYHHNAALIPPIDHAIYQSRMLHLTANASQLTRILRAELSPIAKICYPDDWAKYGWRHGGAVLTLCFHHAPMNTKEAMEACIEIMLRAAQDIAMPFTKGVSYGFSTTRVLNASTRVQSTQRFLRLGVGCDMLDIRDLAGVVVKGMRGYWHVHEMAGREDSVGAP